MGPYAAVTKKELVDLIQRLQQGTVAQKASQHGFDNQKCHIDYMIEKSPAASIIFSEKTTSNAAPSDATLKRLCRPTTASSASRYDFDAQVCHIEYLKQTVQNYPPQWRTLKNQEELEKINSSLARNTEASKAAVYDFDAQRQHVAYLESQDPHYPGNKAYGIRLKKPPFVRVKSKDLDDLVVRLRRPTVASSGGEPLIGKQFDYTKPKTSVTCPEVPGLEKKFCGLKRLTKSELSESVVRLTVPFKRMALTTVKV